MKVPKPDDASKEWFRSLVPEDPAVIVRPMFGNLAAFVNGNMFFALFGRDVAVRLSEEDREELLRTKGASPFEPMPGRAMKEYVVLPRGWKRSRTTAGAWVQRSLAWAAKLPPKRK